MCDIRLGAAPEKFGAYSIDDVDINIYAKVVRYFDLLQRAAGLDMAAYSVYHVEKT